MVGLAGVLGGLSEGSLRVRHRVLLVVAALLLCVRTGAAQSSEPPRVVLTMSAEWQQLAQRIQSELGTMGFDVTVLASEVDGPEALSATARGAGATVGARVEMRPGSVRVWVVDRATGKTLMREFAPTNPEQTSVALHAVELLRASLLELSLPDAPRGDVDPSQSLLEAAGVPVPGAPGPVAEPPPAVAPALQPATPPETERALPAETGSSAPPTSPLLALEIGPAVVGALGDLPRFAALWVNAAFMATPAWRFGAFAFVPLGAMSHEADEGQSETRVTLLGVDTCLQKAGKLLTPAVCLGFSLAYLHTQGQANGVRFDDAEASALSYGGVLRIGLGIAVGRGLALKPEVSAGVQHRYFGIDYAGREAARWGAVWWAPALAFEGQF